MSIEIFQKDANGAFLKIGTTLPPPSTPTPEPTPPIPATNLYDNFDGPLYKLADGAISPNKKWRCLYAGGGVVETRNESSSGTADQYMHLQPRAVTAAGQTSGAALATTQMFKDFDLLVDVCTIKQLRTGSRPNNWEVAWLNWTRSGSTSDINENRFHAYAFTLKVDGWQLEKKDNEAQDDAAEIYLATGSNPDAKLGIYQKQRIRVTGTATGTPKIECWVDGVQLCNYVDNRAPLNSEKMKREGPIVLYTEDAAVGFDNVFITPL